jgi:hypothetical protein
MSDPQSMDHEESSSIDAKPSPAPVSNVLGEPPGSFFGIYENILDSRAVCEYATLTGLPL